MAQSAPQISPWPPLSRALATRECRLSERSTRATDEVRDAESELTCLPGRLLRFAQEAYSLSRTYGLSLWAHSRFLTMYLLLSCLYSSAAPPLLFSCCSVPHMEMGGVSSLVSTSCLQSAHGLLLEMAVGEILHLAVDGETGKGLKGTAACAPILSLLDLPLVPSVQGGLQNENKADTDLCEMVREGTMPLFRGRWD